MKIAIQGYEGSFHQIVAESYFAGADIEFVPCATFRDVAKKVKSGAVNYGVMAVENSIAGSIIANYGILQDAGVQVAGEVYLHIVQNLMALPGTSLDDIVEVQSHPMALQQCHNFLDTHPAWKLIESEDTASRTLWPRNPCAGDKHYQKQLHAVYDHKVARSFDRPACQQSIALFQNRSPARLTCEGFERFGRGEYVAAAIVPHPRRTVALYVPHRHRVPVAGCLLAKPRTAHKKYRKSARLWGV